jgi:diguanylate cyclase (GGDEF)-like protein/PAS domain S-box-containing protein
MDQGESKATLKADNARLRERVRLLEDAVEAMRHGLCMFSPDRRIVLANRRYAEVIGQPPENIRLGMTIRDLVELAMKAGHRTADADADELEAALWDNIKADPQSRVPFERGGRSYDIKAGHTADGSIVATFEDVTARLQVEEALRESEARLRAILDTMPDSVKIFDEAARLVYVNPRGLDLIEAPDLETLASSGFIPVPPEYLPEWLEVHAKVVAGETAISSYDVIGLEGSRRHVEAHSVPIRLPDGSRGHMCISRDVTERKQAEDALRRSEERMRLVQEAAGMGSFEAGADGLMIASDRFFEQLGLPVAEGPVEAKGWAAQIHPDDLHSVVEEIESSMARREENFRGEFRIVRADTGETRWLACSTKIDYNESGSPVRTIGAHLDITERKRAEEALRRSERRLRLIQDATGLADFETDIVGIRSSNGRFYEQVGLPPQSEPINFAQWLEHVHPEDRERLHEEVLRAMREQDSIDCEFRIVRADTGEVRWLATHTGVERDEKGGLIGTIGAHFDITDRKRAEEALRESEARLSAILDTMPDCVKLFDEKSRLTYINPRGLEVLEAPDLETLSSSGHVPVPPEYMTQCVDVHNRVLAGETVVWSYDIVGMRGGRRHVEAHSVPFRMPDGAPAHMCISRDVSERKAAEDALRFSEQRLRLVQEATGLADFEAEPDGTAHVSEALREQLGLPAGTTEISFQELLACIHPEDRDHLKREIERSLDSEETFQCEFRIVHGVTGEVRWIYSRTKMERDETGAATRSIGAHLDITERKRAEEALRESEERFRFAAEAAGLGVWDYDAALNQREWSGRLREIFGISAAATPSLELAAECVHPEDRADFRRQLNEIRDGHIERFETSCRINRADDGRERWVAISGWHVREADGPSRRIIITVRDVTDEKTAEERVRWSASHDPLTRLANRALFQEKLDQAIAGGKLRGEAVGVLMLDLDHFKQVNDSLGHDVGDALLKMFAERLRSVVRHRDTVARLGGDEFAIVVPRLRGKDDLLRLSRSIQERMRAPFVHGGRVLDCRVSSGASMFPDHARSAREILKCADTALYAAKAAGRATVTLYEPHMRDDLQRRVSMVQLARNAIDDDRVIPYYQPKLDLQTGRIDGFEALLRWRNGKGRICPPAALEAAFDDLEVAAAISDRMIDRVIADMRGWLDRGIGFRHVAVNAAAAEFRRDNFAERVLESLRRADIPSRCFQLEVTETVFLGRGAEYVHRALALLNAQGVKIALDDFGTGYASLRHLKQFPVDIIKIDQSFVRDMEVDPGDEAIVRAVINLGKSLGIHVVAEGIEVAAQAERLQRLGCDFGQGFLFSKAVGAKHVPPLVGKWPDESSPLAKRSGTDLRLVASQP